MSTESQELEADRLEKNSRRTVKSAEAFFKTRCVKMLRRMPWSDAISGFKLVFYKESIHTE